MKKILSIIMALLFSVNMIGISVKAQQLDTQKLYPISEEEYNEIIADLDNDENEEALNVPSIGVSECYNLDNFVESGSLNVKSEINTNGLTSLEGVSGIEKIGESDIMTLGEAPVADMSPTINNPESMRDGMITTETEITWEYNHTDPDGDIVTTHYGGFPLNYVIADQRDGFTTRIYTPGTYTILCQVEDAEGNLSEPVGYRITVVPECEYQAIEGSLDSATDIQTYDIDIDFSEMDSAAICLVRMGLSNIAMKVYDENNNLVTQRGANYNNPKNWYFIDKPTSDSTICKYRVEVSASKYNVNSSEYRVLIGNKIDAERMMGGLENVQPLETYYESKSNFIHNYYTPYVDECWYKFTMVSPTTITLLSHIRNVKYVVKETTNLTNIYESEKDPNSFRDKFVNPYEYGEKTKLNMNIGEEFYLVVYNSGTTPSDTLNTNNFLLAVGKPVMTGTYTTVTGRSMSANTSRFSATQTFAVNTSSIPTTAQVEQVELYGISFLNIGKWRLLAPGTSSWKESGTGKSTISYTFTKDSDYNTKMYGPWGFSLKTSSSTATFTPKLEFKYYYEMGD